MPEHLSPAGLCDLIGIALSGEQLAAVTAPLGPALVVAGAGTGKTTVMAARVVWLVATGQVEPGAVLGLTFTRRAAAELARRIDAALARLGPLGDDGPQVFTYDAFVGLLLEGQGPRLGVAPSRLMAGAEPYQLADRAADEPGFEPDSWRQVRPETVSEQLLALDRAMSANLATPEQVRAYTRAFAQACAAAPGHAGGVYRSVEDATQVALARGELVGFVEAYRSLKAAAGLGEFGDQQAAATRLACASPAVGAGLRARFKVVLLDEYQDTSVAQATMLEALFSGPDKSSGRGHPVCAVGDPRQAIYGWRGAAADGMGRFARTFPQADGTAPPVYELGVNRRSGAGIVAAANLVAARLGDASPLRPDQGRSPGRVEAATYTTWPEEVAGVSARLVEAHRSGEATLWADEAVLLRRNRDIPAFYRALTDLGAPVEIVGLGGLLALPEVATIVAVLSLAADTNDNPSAALLATGPACGLGPRDMAALAGRASLLEAMFDPGPGVSEQGRVRLSRLTARIREVRRQRHQFPVDLVQIAVEQLGLAAELDVPSAWSDSCVSQVRRFVAEVADHVGRTSQTSLTSLLRWLRDEAAHGGQLDQATPSEADSVKLLTVHRAKGLEWSVVALPALARDVFPNDRVGGNPVKTASALPFELRLDADALPTLSQVSDKGFKAFARDLKQDQEASEDRLGYVAVSRAKSVLLVSASHWRAGAARARPPSRLFDLLAPGADVVVSAPPPGDVNPLGAALAYAAWPVTLDAAQQHRLDDLAAAVSEPPPVVDGVLTAEDTVQAARWRAQAARLLAEAGGAARVPMPESVSASALMLAFRDEPAFFADQARPMPKLTDPGAATGSAFHAWVQQRLTKPGRLGETDPTIAQLVAAFEEGPYAALSPLAVEVPFVAVIAGRQVRGRIDAVFPGEGPFQYQLVDWKTSPGPADPMQLAIYRLAWAEANGCDPQQVDAVFYHVMQRRVLRPGSVSRTELEEWVSRL